MSEFLVNEGEARSRNTIIALNRIGKLWIKALHTMLKTVQVHESKNQIFDEPIRQWVSLTNEILDLEGAVSFQVVNDQFFLNRLWIKPTIGERETIYSVVDLLKSAHLGSITIRTALSDTHVRSFLDAFLQSARSEKTRADELNRLLATYNIEEVEVGPPVVSMDEPSDLPLPPAAYSAVIAYAKVLLCLKEFVSCAPGEEQVASLRKIQRMLCELIDLARTFPCLFYLLSILRGHDSYFLHHGVNVFILSLLFAQSLGMDRRYLIDLGMASLLFDSGKLMLPDSILSKREKLTRNEVSLIQSHSIETASLFLSLGYMNDSVAERVIVGYQHHWSTRAPNAYPKPRRDMKPTLISEIVGLFDRYDALVSDKPYRLGLTPRQAIRWMEKERQENVYRPELFDAFLRFLGPLPAGSWVKMEPGGEALVVLSGLYSSHPPLPILYREGEWITPKSPTEFKGLKITPLRPKIDDVRKIVGKVLQGVEGSPLI